MSLASVSPIQPARRTRKPKAPAVRLEMRRARLTEALARAASPTQRVAAAFDYLRAALADTTTDQQTAEATAATVVQLLVEHADQIATPGRTR